MEQNSIDITIGRVWGEGLGGYGERGARAYNGSLGAVSPAGSRGRAPSGGVRGFAESFLAVGHPTK